MLKKAHRLSTKQFMEVMEKGRIITSPLFVVRMLVNKPETGVNNQNISGISAVTPKKIAVTAVMRNRIRRQIYAAVRPLKNTLTPGISLIIFAKQEALKADTASMSADLKQLFVKARIGV
jgi:ribonuclease P protein component